MKRILSVAAALAIVLTLTASVEAAQKKKKKKVNTGTIVGTITAVSGDGKSFTVTSLGGKKNKTAGATELKLTERTKVEFIGIKDTAERKLAVGYVVLVAVDEANPGTASVIAAGKAAVGKKKKKKDSE
jgi:hypothetical protein